MCHAKYKWVLAYAIDEAIITAIAKSPHADIKRILENKHACASEEERDAAMRRPRDFKDGEVWLTVKMGCTNPPRPLGKHRLQKMDAETLKAEHAYICWASALGDMTKEKRISKIGTNGTFTHQEVELDSERQAHTGRNQSSACDVCKTVTTLTCTTLGSSAVMLKAVVISVKLMTQSVRERERERARAQKERMRQRERRIKRHVGMGGGGGRESSSVCVCMCV